MSGGRMTKPTVRAARAALLVLGLAAAAGALEAQTEPRLASAVRLAQEGLADSARTAVEAVLAGTAVSDTLYPQALYAMAMVSSSVADMERYLQRVVVEYPTSSWMDEALLRLAQSDYANGNLAGAARSLERIRLDYPGTPLFPAASYWAARTYFDMRNAASACRWINDGIVRVGGDIEVRNQLEYYRQRCATAVPESSSVRSVDTVDLRPASAARNAAPPAAPRPDAAALKPAASTATSAPAPAAAPPAAATTPAAPAATTPSSTTPSSTTPPAAPSAASTPPAADAARPFRVQVAAVGSQRAADAAVRSLRNLGYAAVVAREGGLYKVRTAPYRSRSEASAAATQINAKLGGAPFVVADR
jgi:cell division septation protein DedD